MIGVVVDQVFNLKGSGFPVPSQVNNDITSVAHNTCINSDIPSYWPNLQSSPT